MVSLVLPAVLGNALFYTKCRRQMAAAVAAHATLAQACAALGQRSSSRRRSGFLVLMNWVWLGIAALIYALLVHPAPLLVPVSPRIGEVSGVLSAAPVVLPAPVARTAPAVASMPEAVVQPASQNRATQTEQAPVAVPAAAPAGHYVNAGLFAQAANARKTQARLLAAGLPVVTQKLQVRGQVLTRVQAGPFANRAKAQRAVAKIHALKLEASLAPP
ncbi:sporulation related domain protein [mine drainage metagenome]|uniref:Sporulation related domain protein n=1 Tax=mine drainage metagenome TaxID=410659 RepID=A0A1J5PNY4_9ZZZZ